MPPPTDAAAPVPPCRHACPRLLPEPRSSRLAVPRGRRIFPQDQGWEGGRIDPPTARVNHLNFRRCGKRGGPDRIGAPPGREAGHAANRSRDPSVRGCPSGLIHARAGCIPFHGDRGGLRRAPGPAGSALRRSADDVQLRATVGSPKRNTLRRKGREAARKEPGAPSVASASSGTAVSRISEGSYH